MRSYSERAREATEGCEPKLVVWGVSSGWESGRCLPIVGGGGGGGGGVGEPGEQAPPPLRGVSPRHTPMITMGGPSP